MVYTALASRRGAAGDQAVTLDARVSSLQAAVLQVWGGGGRCCRCGEGGGHFYLNRTGYWETWYTYTRGLSGIELLLGLRSALYFV